MAKLMGTESEKYFKDCLARAEAGEAVAQMLVAVAYVQGRGVCRDYVAAMGWYRKAAEQGGEGHMLLLGNQYENGRICPMDLTEAVNWYKKAAEQGGVQAQIKLSRCYQDGVGLTKSPELAAAWTQKAVETAMRSDNVHPRVLGSALGRLGYLYENAIGLPDDVTKAAAYYERAAELDCKWAQLEIAFCYEEGIGVPVDLPMAYGWYEVHGRAMDPKFLAKLTPRQVASGKKKTKALKKLIEFRMGMVYSRSSRAKLSDSSSA